MSNQLSIQSVLSEAWDLFTKTWKAWYKFMLGMFVGLVILGIIGGIVAESGFLSAIVGLANWVFQILLGMAVIAATLKLVRGQSVTFDLIKEQTDKVVSYLAASIVVGVIVMVGLLLLIVPGLIWAYKYMFSLYLVIDKKMGPFEAMKRSEVLTNGHKMWLFAFSLVLVLINLAGALALGLGLLLTIPLSAYAQALVYQKLLAMSGEVPAASKVAAV